MTRRPRAILLSLLLVALSAIALVALLTFVFEAWGL